MIHRKGAHQPLTEHAVCGLPDNVVPGETVLIAALLQPDLFVCIEIDGTDPGGRTAFAHLLQLTELTFQPELQGLCLIWIKHLNHGAGHEGGAALLKGCAVLHQGILGCNGVEGSQHTRLKIGFQQPGKAGRARNNQAEQQDQAGLKGSPAQQSPRWTLMTQPASP